MMYLSSLTLATLITAVLAAPTKDHVLHEKRNMGSSAWQKRNAVPADMVLPMRIGLKQTNIHRGHDLLMDVSSPSSPNFGKYYTAEEVSELFAPEPSTVESVRAWLEEAGIPKARISQSVNKGWIQFDADTTEAEALLKTKYYFFEHADTGDANIACDEYHVPAHVRDHIAYVTPGIKLIPNGGGSTRSKAQRDALVKRGFGKSSKPAGPTIRKPLPGNFDVVEASNSTANCDKIISPACIKALYGIPLATTADASNTMGIYEYGDEWDEEDMDLFFTNVYPTVPKGTYPSTTSIDGGVSNDGTFNSVYGEALLDLQLAYPIVYPQKITVLQTDDPVAVNQPYQGLFNNMLDAIDGSYCTYSAFGETGNDPTYDPPYPDPLSGGYKGQLQCGVYKPTNVISISYGINEYDISANYQQRQCNEWMKLGLQGVSVVVASGDSGVGGRVGQNGHTNGCLGDDGKVFNPDYPGTCPYLTMVGSTYIPPGGSVSTEGSEVATTSFSSGGGFSNIYPIPDYQKDAVEAYFTNADPIVQAYPYYSASNLTGVGANGGIYNRNGRGYPDVSALGDNILVYAYGQQALYGGTSASAPIFASILNRINEERLAAGKSTVGFVNPTLYAHPEAFNDVTKGNNTACGTAGFIASTGWDPLTGLGTPKYSALLDLFMSLP